MTGQANSNVNARVLGAAVMAIGAALNAGFLGRLLAADGDIAPGVERTVIACFQGVLLAIGARLLLLGSSWPALGRRAIAVTACAAAAVAAAGNVLCATLRTDSPLVRSSLAHAADRARPADATREAPPRGASDESARQLRPPGTDVDDLAVNDEFKARVKDVYDSEQLLMVNMPRLADLVSSVADLKLPDYRSRDMFHESATIVDLAAGEPVVTGVSFDALNLRSSHVPVSSASGSTESGIWESYLSQVSYFEHAGFYFVDARFGEGRNEWHAELGFQGLARTAGGQWHAVAAMVDSTWSQPPGTDDPLSGWRISAWRTREFKISAADDFLFHEVSAAALPDPQDLRRARRSMHEELVAESMLEPTFQQPHEFFSRSAWDHHPGLSVVDIDGDGWDDIYLMERWGENQLLHNQGDGTFREVAAAFGLDLRDHCSCAVFADFDNDGDQDVFIGRTIVPSVYLRNEGGRFYDRSEVDVLGRMPCFASSVSAVDYDQDGLLDIFVSTYAAKSLARKRNLSRFVNPADVKRFDPRENETEYDSFVNAVGPRNVLFRNIGDGRLEEVPDTALGVFRNTYQSTWGDFDDDGDPDVYCANDFAPDNMFRNDGQGRFTDITTEAGFTETGLAMGASWGDYDNDGRLDLYVSNMYSKAGQRIIRQLGSIEPRLKQTAQGNALFRNAGGHFEKVSGTDPKMACVEKAGWSWGGQFVDIDNDGDQDIYALSGFYTAPRGLALPVDS